MAASVSWGVSTMLGPFGLPPKDRTEPDWGRGGGGFTIFEDPDPEDESKDDRRGRKEREKQIENIKGAERRKPPFLRWEEDEDPMYVIYRKRPLDRGETASWRRNVQEELADYRKVQERYLDRWIYYFDSAIEDSNRVLFDPVLQLAPLAKAAENAKKEFIRHARNLVYLNRVANGNMVYDLGSYTVEGSPSRLEWRFNDRNKVVDEDAGLILGPSSDSKTGQEIDNAREIYSQGIHFFESDLKVEGRTIHDIQTEFYKVLGIPLRALNATIEFTLEENPDRVAQIVLNEMNRRISLAKRTRSRRARLEANTYYRKEVLGRLKYLKENAITTERFLFRGEKPGLPTEINRGGRTFDVAVYPMDPIDLWKIYHDIRLDRRRYQAIQAQAEKSVVIDRDDGF